MALFSPRFRSERGIALPIALGMLLVVSIGLIAVLQTSRSGQRHSKLSQADQVAVAVAEAGLNEAESVLLNSPTPTLVSALPSQGAPGIVNAEGGTARYWGTLDTAPAPDRWTVTSESSVANPTGAAPVTHRVTVQFNAIPATWMSGNEAWNYVFSNTTASCFVMQNNFDIYSPLYVQGNYCAQNDGDFFGPLLDVRGTLQQSGTADVGSAGSPVPQARIAGGCRLGTSGPFSTPCTSAQRVWTSSFSSTPPALTKPTADSPYWRTNAKPGPNQYCTSGTFPGGAGSFTTLGTINLTPGTSYDCIVTGGSPATTLGRIAWSNATRVLTVTGVIYFDGNIEFDGNFNGTVSGSGVVYANTVSFRNDAKLCGVSGCATTGWDPNVALLVVVARGTAANAISLANASKFQGAAYAVGGFRIENAATMQGPVVAETVDVQNGGLIASWPPLTALIPGMPSTYPVGGVATIVPGSWRG